MLLRRFTDFVLQSRVQAMAAAFLIAFIPVIGTISILIAALVTLRKGAREGGFVIIAATAPYIISYFSTTQGSSDPLGLGMLGVMVFGNILTWVFAVILRQYSSWNIVIEIAGLFGLLAIILIHLFYPDIQNWWAQQIQNYFNKTAELVAKLGPDAETKVVPKEAQFQVIAIGKQYATGFITASLLVNALTQLLLARWWQAALFNPGGLRKELQQIRLSHISGAIFLIALILAYFSNGIAVDVMPVVYTMFFAAGLSLIHYILNLSSNSWLWLLIAYVGIIWLFPMSFILIAIVALLDSGLDFRKRFKLMKR